ncbi:hypothetical protein KVV02_001449 [Mortierella alpina]|uniref:Uncharacterized protein n=1 Tax=Mortierella alpina TaxID=64518 RepID=A0A9P7ZYG9_MORAP|nr:hypothetical protein KVV02_001449 [Mortierella alpina]
MEGASATRLRFKGKADSSSHKKRTHSDRHPIQDQTHRYHRSSQRRGRSRSRSRSRSPRRRSRSPDDPSRTHRRHDSSHTSSSRSRRTPSKYKVTPAGYAPETYTDYVFDTAAQCEQAAAFALEQERDLEEIRQLGREQEKRHLDDFWLRDRVDDLEFHTSHFSGWDMPTAGRSPSSNPSASRNSREQHINAMPEDDYASYMRRGMGRSTQDREAQEWAEWVQEKEQNRYQEAKEEQRWKDEQKRQRRQKRKEREQLEAEEEAAAHAGVGSHQEDILESDSLANRLRKRVLVDSARREYESRWKILTEDTKFVSMDTIAWPPLGTTPTRASLSSSSLRTDGLSLFEFLFFGTNAKERDLRKQILRREQLKFHPDKFRQRFGARLPRPFEEAALITGEREMILEKVDRVAQALNEIGEMI